MSYNCKLTCPFPPIAAYAHPNNTVLLYFFTKFSSPPLFTTMGVLSLTNKGKFDLFLLYDLIIFLYKGTLSDK